MDFTKKRALILAPHTDDAELGCGGTIARMVEEGAVLRIAAFSTAEESLPKGAPRSQLRDEFRASTRVLGIKPSNLHIYQYPVRKLSYHRQEVLEELVRLRRDFSPEIVIGPAATDLHQDHQVLHSECMRAFKETTVFGYELPWNHVTFSANAFIILNDRHIRKKWSALRTYRSQIALKRAYFTREFVYALAKLRGVQVKSRFAESFEVYRICV